MKVTKEPKSLNKRLLLFMIFCWVVPIAVFFAFTTVSYRSSIIEKAEDLMEDEVKNISSAISVRIGEAINLCQRPSYDNSFEDEWRSYKNGKTGWSSYMQSISATLASRFYVDSRFNVCAYYSKYSLRPDSYTSRTGYPNSEYLEKIQPSIDEFRKLNSSYAYVTIIDGRMFIIRNLYSTRYYEKYGTLVLEMNKDKIFYDVPNDYLENMMVCIGNPDDIIDFTDLEDNDERKNIAQALLGKYDENVKWTVNKEYDERYNGYVFQQSYDTYHMGVLLFAERREIYSSIYDMYTIVFAMLILFCPVIWFGMHFFHREIWQPIERLIAVSKQIEGGEIGAADMGGVMPNLEFNYLRESINSMSYQVKYLFDCAYDEKLARKDAQIQALQAQINPHFLNNTLEMMNWQARMSGDAIVSKMIESLATVLDYRMNRASINEIHLAEELKCTDAYFYIMSMRFGQRLQIDKEIDDTLLYIMVPPLILQPIVENAIVHGVETMKNGTIRLKISHDEANVYIQVKNTSREMSDQDKERIQAILDGDADKIPKIPGRHTSIGIRNVNQRIKLIYGEEYGLTIDQQEDQMTVSTITIPYREEKSGIR